MTTPLRTTQQHKRKGGLSGSAWEPSWQAQAPLPSASPLLLLEDPFNDSDCDMQTSASFPTTTNAVHGYSPTPSSSTSSSSTSFFSGLGQQLREPGVEVLGHKHAASSEKQSMTTRCRSEVEASSDIFSLLESKVRQLERVAVEFNQALDITALQPYFGDVGAQLRLISLDTTKRLAEFSTFYHWLRQHNTPLGVTPAGYFSILPEELSMYILSFLDVHELACVERVSRYWRRLVEDDQVWHRLHRARWGSGAHSQLVRQMSFERSGSASDSGDEEAPEEAVMATSSAMTTSRRAKRKRRGWRDVYVEADRLEKNWRAGKYSTKPVQRSTAKPGLSHPQEIAYCIKFDEHRMVTGSNDRCVRLSDIRSGQLLHTLAGHAAEVRSVDFDSTKIASGSRDRSVKVWDINTGQCLITMNEHAGPVKCMQMTDDLIMSGSEDATIKVLDLNSGQVVNTFSGHVWGVACLQFRDNFVVSGSRDRRVFLWDKRVTRTTAADADAALGRHQKQTSLLRVMEGHSNTVRCVAFDEENIVSGSWDNTIKVWSVATGQLRNTLEGHDGRVLHLDFDRHKIVSGSVDKTVRVWWDYDTPSRSSTAYSLVLHQAPIFHLRFDDYGITSASRDTELIRWDFYSPCADDVRKTRRSLRAAAGGGLA